MTQRERWALLAFTAFALAVSLWLAAPFLSALTWALVLALVGQPLQRLLERRVRKRGVRAAITTTILVSCVALPVLVAAPLVAGEAADAWQDLRSESVEARISGVMQRFPALAPVFDWVRQHAPPAEDFAGRIAERVPSLMTASAWVALQWLVAFFAAYFFLRDKDLILQWLRSTLPLSEQNFARLKHRIAEVVEASVVGSLSVAAVQGVLGGFIFWVLDLPAAMLWGLVMGVLSLLPMLGAAIVWAPAAALLLLEGSWQAAIGLVVWGAVVVGLIDNLLYPLLVGKKLRLHTLAVFIALVGGLLTMGATGLVWGPLMLALAAELLSLWRTREPAVGDVT